MEEIRPPSFLMSRDPSVDRRCRPRAERQVNLFVLEEETVSISDDESESGIISLQSEEDLCGEVIETNQTASVFLRLRPVKKCSFSTRYSVHENVLITQHNETTNSKNNVERHFQFTDIFDETIDQQIIYDKCVRPMIENEENLTVLTYGTSGSGKTFTLLGDSKNPGIIPRALENLFSFYEDNINTDPWMKIVNGKMCLVDTNLFEQEDYLLKTLLSMNSVDQKAHQCLQESIQNNHNFIPQNLKNKSIFIWISFIEIYNEVIYDLLSMLNLQNTKIKRKPLRIGKNGGNVFIKNLTSVHVKTSYEAYQLLQLGIKNATYASTAINSRSSRSHSIFFIDFLTYSEPDVFTCNSYKFCDLAGSERLQKTDNIGTRLKETQRINTSLMVLGKCLNAACNNQNKKKVVVPFRESKLTMLLQTPLTGTEKISMIVNVTPMEDYYEENLNVLGFSSIAKNIVFKSTTQQKRRSARLSWFAPSSLLKIPTNEIDILNDEIITLRSQIEELNQENFHLRQELLIQEAKLRKDLTDDCEKQLEIVNKRWEERYKHLETSLTTLYENRIKRLEEKHRQEMENAYEDENEISDESSTSFEHFLTGRKRK